MGNVGTPLDSPFKGFPEHVWVLAEAGEDGLYRIHAKVHPNGKCKTFSERVGLREALEMTEQMREWLGLPKESILMSVTESVLKAPHVDNRRLKHYMEKRK
ncbi:hypothetical protein [Brevibacillus sp. NRS-1366]|uniref:hypothetical protein n=1 Tax=Brevibacillus sp. NRS-1366 TaxID=3233899 RepID=UPI003D1B70A1